MNISTINLHQIDPEEINLKVSGTASWLAIDQLAIFGAGDPYTVHNTNSQLKNLRAIGLRITELADMHYHAINQVPHDPEIEEFLREGDYDSTVEWMLDSDYVWDCEFRAWRDEDGNEVTVAGAISGAMESAAADDAETLEV